MAADKDAGLVEVTQFRQHLHDTRRAIVRTSVQRQNLTRSSVVDKIDLYGYEL
jgi:hypothetical protein